MAAALPIIANIMNRAFGIPTPHGQVKGGSTADAEQQGNGNTDGCEGEGDIGGGIAQLTDALSDKNLIDNVIQCTDQHGNDAGNGKIAQQSADFFCF